MSVSRDVKFRATVVEDERWLDGSRHVGLVGALDESEAELYFVVDHDGVLTEAELTIGEPEDANSVALAGDQESLSCSVNWDELELRLEADSLRVETQGRPDGDVDVHLLITKGGA